MSKYGPWNDIPDSELVPCKGSQQSWKVSILITVVFIGLVLGFVKIISILMEH